MFLKIIRNMPSLYRKIDYCLLSSVIYHLNISIIFFIRHSVGSNFTILYILILGVTPFLCIQTNCSVLKTKTKYNFHTSTWQILKLSILMFTGSVPDFITTIILWPHMIIQDSNMIICILNHVTLAMHEHG